MACPCDSLGLRPKPRAMDGCLGPGSCRLGRGVVPGPPVKERSRICRKAFHYIGENPGPQAALFLFGSSDAARSPIALLSESARKLQAGPRPSSPLTEIASAPPLLVLDTNVVLDWLYFADPASDHLSRAIRERQVRWIASQAMRDEIEHVLQRGISAQRPPAVRSVLAEWDRWASMTVADDGPLPAALRCTDADDQKFIDLALRCGASALLTRDRAVLKLARRARDHGLSIQTTVAWMQQRSND